jgi:hypothetical protein
MSAELLGQGLARVGCDEVVEAQITLCRLTPIMRRRPTPGVSETRPLATPANAAEVISGPARSP